MSVKFYLRKQSITCAFIVNRKVIEFSIGVKIDGKYWDEKKQRCKGTYANATKLNRHLQNLEDRLTEIYIDHKGADLTTIKRLVTETIKSDSSKKKHNFELV